MTEDLPTQFQERIRPDIVKRAVLSIESKNIQPEGTSPEAGMQHVTRWRQRRRVYRRSKGLGRSRTPRKIMQGRGMQQLGEGAEAPQTRGGRTAHPPKAEKDHSEEINNKERRKAIRSAIAATNDKELVNSHHEYDGELPLTTNEVSEIEKTSELQNHLEELGLEEELERASQKKVRSGKGANRGRKYARKRGPLLVIAEDEGISKAASNIPGLEISLVDQLNAQKLSMGEKPGRLTIWTEKSLEKLDEEELYQ